MIVEDIFRNTKINFSKLLHYGFKKNNNLYNYETPVLNNQFKLIVKVNNNEQISTKLIDEDTKDEYILHLMEDSTGEFVGKVRHEYERVLIDIKNNCSEEFIFKSKQAQEIIKYIQDKYNDELEYLWEKFPDNAIWRCKENRKWYALLLTVTRKKLGLDDNKKIEIIDLRFDESKISNIIDNKTIFPGYHMNKKHWITICLDNSVQIDKIYDLIDNSYTLAKIK